MNARYLIHIIVSRGKAEMMFLVWNVRIHVGLTLSNFPSSNSGHFNKTPRKGMFVLLSSLNGHLSTPWAWHFLHTDHMTSLAGGLGYDTTQLCLWQKVLVVIQMDTRTISSTLDELDAHNLRAGKEPCLVFNVTQISLNIALIFASNDPKLLFHQFQTNELIFFFCT